MNKILNLVLSTLLLIQVNTKILELTNKNLPNVLRTIPEITTFYHNSECKYSREYKIHFTRLFTNSEQVLGIVDCQQEVILCKSEAINNYPIIKIMSLHNSSVVQNPYLFLGQHSESLKSMPEYVNSEIVERLGAFPYFILVIFEEEGFPILNKVNIESINDRIFYLEKGRTVDMLKGFVNGRDSSWIFYVENGKLESHSCGDGYNGDKVRICVGEFVAKLGNESLGKVKAYVADSSDYTVESKTGYSEFSGWLKHYLPQLQSTTNPTISVCLFLYLWSNNCQHCNFGHDMKVLKETVERAYTKDISNSESGAIYKNTVQSYDIGANKMPLLKREELHNLTSISLENIRSEISGSIHIVPNIISVCFSTKNNENINEVKLNVRKFDRVIGYNSLENFVAEVLKSEHAHIDPKAKDEEL